MISNDFKQEVSVICLNPSKANKFKSDSTINNVVKFFYSHKELKIGTVSIYNLYPFYATDPKDLHPMFESMSKIQYQSSINDHFPPYYIR
ncbi:DUF1643 domain-containing protein [Bacillus tequilensis]|uniref:DUF1643 domain-containing protein n=1 Tax=Bacillus tequilensis TaxID=227866 RepID=A0A6H0WHW0_9BACI|nr:DUF1643 domain-containing protein [Bacillus tequilensis]